MLGAVKIDMKTKEVVIEDEQEDVSIEEVAEDLPEFSPRYIAYRSAYPIGNKSEIAI